MSGIFGLPRTSHSHPELEAYADAAVDGAIPLGGIIMWSGAVADIPSQWALCDGANGTPDLRGRMVVGASGDTGGTNSGASYDKGATGGADSVTLAVADIPSHDHGGVSGGQSATHTHGISTGGVHDHTVGYEYNTNAATSGAGRIVVDVDNQTGGAGTNATATTANSINHDHGGATGNASVGHDHTIAAEGGDGGHENRPRFYALAYIMRVS